MIKTVQLDYLFYNIIFRDTLKRFGCFVDLLSWLTIKLSVTLELCENVISHAYKMTVPRAQCA